MLAGQSEKFSRMVLTIETLCQDKADVSQLGVTYTSAVQQVLHTRPEGRPDEGTHYRITLKRACET